MLLKLADLVQTFVEFFRIEDLDERLLDVVLLLSLCLTSQIRTAFLTAPSPSGISYIGESNNIYFLERLGKNVISSSNI